MSIELVSICAIFSSVSNFLQFSILYDARVWCLKVDKNNSILSKTVIHRSGVFKMERTIRAKKKKKKNQLFFCCLISLFFFCMINIGEFFNCLNKIDLQLLTAAFFSDFQQLSYPYCGIAAVVV